MDNLILIGFMGCGKSTLGVSLSKRLDIPFLDTDKYIEDGQKTSISDIFAKQGEAVFRRLETDCLKELLEKSGDVVISTGGGIVICEENRRLLKELGTAVYVKVSPETVYERLKEDNTRPLLQGTNPLEKIKALMQQRSRFYEEAASVVLEADKKSVEELTQEICSLIERRKR